MVLLVVTYLCESVLVRLFEGRPVSLVDPTVIVSAVLMVMVLAIPQALPLEFAYGRPVL